MRSFNPAFASLLAGKNKRPRFVLQVSFSDAAADDVYIRSHGDIDLTHALRAVRWEFSNSANSWTAADATLTTFSTYVTATSTGADPRLTSPTIGVDGSAYRKVRARVRRMAGSGWQGALYYTTSGHGVSESFQKTIADTTVTGAWVTLEFDMANLTAGGADWTTSAITALRLDLGASSSDVFDIDWIDIGGAPTILASRTQKISVLSQQIYPDDGRATIGSFSFDALDVSQSLTTAQRGALNTESHGLRNKFVKLWIGFAELDFDDYELYSTQIVYGVKYASNVYSFTCNDVQREARKQIFAGATLALAQPIDATTTTIPINGDTSLIQALEHDNAFTDGAGLTVAYVKIDKEIIRIPSTGIVANQFTGVTRGTLGTRAAAHDTDTSVTADQQKKVEEVIYLEMNAVKMAYAVLTGVLANQSTFMPDTWHAGIDTSFIDVSSFDNIGDDLYDGTDEGGIILRFLGLDGEDAKAWVEKQVCRIIGCYMPIRSNGKLALRRLERVLHGASPIADLTDRELMGAVDLTYAMNQVYNRLEIDWNAIDGDATRFTEIDDQESINKWQASDVKIIEAFGLHGSRHSADAVRQLFERYRDRYSGPPVTASPRVRLAMAALEVGDIVRVVSATARDFTDPRAAGTLDRSFEVQATSLNWMTGEFRPTLFGSTQAASPLPRAITSQAIPDAWFDDLGTNIAGLSGVTLTSGVYHMTSNLTFAGGASNRTSGSVWYILGDLNIDSGVVLTISGNVQIRVRGVLTVNGSINGVGLGLTGVADTLDASAWPYLDMNNRTPWTGVTCQLGQVGYYGSPRAGGGLFERARRESSGGEYWIDDQSFAAPATEGEVNIVPTYQIAFDGTMVTGIPSSLLGSSGGPGGKRSFSNQRNGSREINDGGAGGDSGAGLFVVCRGMAFGVSGFVNLSGTDGDVGGYNAADNHPAHAGGGAGGAPGAFICVVDGVLNPLPVLSDQTFIATYGVTPDPADPPGFSDMQTAWLSDKIELPGGDRPANARSYFISPTSGLKAGLAAARALFLSTPQANGVDGSDEASAAAQVISLAVTQNPIGTGDPRSTRLTATVTLVSVTSAYGFANIYARRASDSGLGVRVGQADNDCRFDLPAEGVSYVITAVPVLINFTEAPASAWVTQSITLVNVGVIGALPVIVDFSDADAVRNASQWVNHYNNGVAAIIAETGTPPPSGGNYVWAFGDNAGDDSFLQYQIGALAIPLDLNVLYRVVFHLRRAAGAGTFYAGVIGWDAARTATIDQSSGASPFSGLIPWVAANAANPGDTAWHVYVGYFKRTGGAATTTVPASDPQAPMILHPNTQFVSLAVAGNQSAAAGISQIGFANIERVGAAGEVPTDGLALNAVTATYEQQTAGPIDVVVTSPSTVTSAIVGYIDIPKPPPDEALEVTCTFNAQVQSGTLNFTLAGAAAGLNTSTTIFSDVGHSMSIIDATQKTYAVTGRIQIVDPYFGATDWTDPVRIGLGLYVNVTSGQSCTFRVTNLTVRITRFKR